MALVEIMVAYKDSTISNWFGITPVLVIYPATNHVPVKAFQVAQLPWTLATSSWIPGTLKQQIMASSDGSLQGHFVNITYGYQRPALSLKNQTS